MLESSPPERNEATRTFVEQRKREHPAEPAEGVRSPAPPRFEDHFGIRTGDETGAEGHELVAKLLVVVELAVVDESEPMLGQRLVCGMGQVDDREPAVREMHADATVLVRITTSRVRAAVGDPRAHFAYQRIPVSLLEAASDPAHPSAS